MASWHKGKFAWSAYGRTTEGLIYQLAGGRWQGEVLDASRNGFVLHRDEYPDLAAAKRDIGARLDGSPRSRAQPAGGSVKARWAEVRRLEAAGKPLQHPRAYVFGLDRRGR